MCGRGPGWKPAGLKRGCCSVAGVRRSEMMVHRLSCLWAIPVLFLCRISSIAAQACTEGGIRLVSHIIVPAFSSEAKVATLFTLSMLSP